MKANRKRYLQMWLGTLHLWWNFKQQRWRTVENLPTNNWIFFQIVYEFREIWVGRLCIIIWNRKKTSKYFILPFFFLVCRHTKTTLVMNFYQLKTTKWIISISAMMDWKHVWIHTNQLNFGLKLNEKLMNSGRKMKEMKYTKNCNSLIC